MNKLVCIIWPSINLQGAAEVKRNVAAQRMMAVAMAVIGLTLVNVWFSDNLSKLTLEDGIKFVTHCWSFAFSNGVQYAISMVCAALLYYKHQTWVVYEETFKLNMRAAIVEGTVFEFFEKRLNHEFIMMMLCAINVIATIATIMLGAGDGAYSYRFDYIVFLLLGVAVLFYSIHKARARTSQYLKNEEVFGEYEKEWYVIRIDSRR